MTAISTDGSDVVGCPTEYGFTDLRVESGVPYEQPKGGRTNRYKGLFNAMNPGDSIACHPKELTRLYNALRFWIEQRGKRDVWCIRMRKNADNGMSRIWLMER